jgi:hypothetical protein
VDVVALFVMTDRITQRFEAFFRRRDHLSRDST